MQKTRDAREIRAALLLLPATATFHWHYLRSACHPLELGLSLSLSLFSTDTANKTKNKPVLLAVARFFLVHGAIVPVVLLKALELDWTGRLFISNSRAGHRLTARLTDQDLAI